jgi:hypothetical protein
MTPAALPQGQVMGPTWARNEAGKFVLPQLTLGWRVIDWCEEYLLQPDGPEAGQPWRFTNEQKRFLLWWYAIDQQGRFIYRAGMLRRMKGWGKDPLAAVICCAEFIGPCRFSGWEADGQPKAEPHYAACVQIAAVSQDQVKRNTMSLFPGLFSTQARREHELDVGKEQIYAFGGRCRIEMLTTSARSSEGPRPTFILKNETQHWIAANGGDDMSAVCARNAAKSRDGSTRTLAISNAHAPGEMSDAELDFESYLQQGEGFLFDSIQASPAVTETLRRLKEARDLEDAEREALRGELIGELRFCAGDSYWLVLDRLLADCEDPRRSMNELLRFYFNVLAAAEDRVFNPARWSELAKPDYRIPAGALCTAGFDGSVSHDHTALVLTEVATGHQEMLGYWEPRLGAGPDGGFAVPVDEVEAAVAAMFEGYYIWALYADPYWWMEQVASWAGKYNEPGRARVVSYSTTEKKRMALALLAYRNAQEGGELTHDGDARFAACMANAHKRTQQFRDDNNEPMWTIEKERPDSPFKIDAAMAGCLSWTARNAAVAAGVLELVDDGPQIFLGGEDEEDA